MSERNTEESELQTLEREVVIALAAHQRWREAMRKATAQHAVASTVAPITACDLTSWLEGRLPEKFRTTALYERTIVEHVAFHNAMERIVGRDPTGARAFARAAIRLKSSLDDWLTLARKR